MTITTITDPAPILATWPTHHGITGHDIDENDGDTSIVLHGHHDGRRAVAALHALARTTWGRKYATTKELGSYREILAALEHQRAAFVEPGPDWALTFQVDATTPGTFPITLWRNW